MINNCKQSHHDRDVCFANYSFTFLAHVFRHVLNQHLGNKGPYVLLWEVTHMNSYDPLALTTLTYGCIHHGNQIVVFYNLKSSEMS